MTARIGNYDESGNRTICPHCGDRMAITISQGERQKGWYSKCVANGHRYIRRLYH